MKKYNLIISEEQLKVLKVSMDIRINARKTLVNSNKLKANERFQMLREINQCNTILKSLKELEEQDKE